MNSVQSFRRRPFPSLSLSFLAKCFPGKMAHPARTINNTFLTHSRTQATRFLHKSQIHTSSYTRILFELLFTRVKGLGKVIVLSTAQFQESTCLYGHLSHLSSLLSHTHFRYLFITPAVIILLSFCYIIQCCHGISWPYDSQNCSSLSQSFLFLLFNLFLNIFDLFQMFNQFLSYLRTHVQPNVFKGVFNCLL